MESPNYQMKKSLKIVVLGDSCVGKTCLITQVFERKMPTQYSPTIETQYYGTTKVDGGDTSISVLDIGGYYVTDSRGFTEQGFVEQCIAQNQGAVLVYSITSKSSFIKAKHLSALLRNNVAASKQDMPYPVSIVGNKCDVLHREVSFEEAYLFARHYNFNFNESSAKSASNVDLPFHSIVRQLCNAPQGSQGAGIRMGASESTHSSRPSSETQEGEDCEPKSRFSWYSVRDSASSSPWDLSLQWLMSLYTRLSTIIAWTWIRKSFLQCTGNGGG